MLWALARRERTFWLRDKEQRGDGRVGSDFYVADGEGRGKK